MTDWDVVHRNYDSPNRREWGVLDCGTGAVTIFDSEQEARDWMDPNVGNPNPGEWMLVTRMVERWRPPPPDHYRTTEPAITAPAEGAPLEEQALWVLSQPKIVRSIRDKKILAIKDTRAATMWGLKEAKEAVEMATDLLVSRSLPLTEVGARTYLRRYGPIDPVEQARQEQEAIASILGQAQQDVLNKERLEKLGNAIGRFLEEDEDDAHVRDA